MTIHYLDRETKKIEVEKVYGEEFLISLYKNSFFSQSMRHLITSTPCVSSIYGFIQKTAWSKSKIIPFIEKFDLDTSEFAEKTSSFHSFNDFFIRKLKKESRPLGPGVILPADARYLFFPKLTPETTFLAKGSSFNLRSFLQDEALAQKYEGGVLLLARLCPVDYHRFHFPCDGTPSAPQKIRGKWLSVNPIATHKRPSIFWENKRELTLFSTENAGTIAIVAIGATNVGTIHSTFTPNSPVQKGDEMGYFSFGGSSLALLFEKDAVHFAHDLIEASTKGLETFCKMGQPLETPLI